MRELGIDLDEAERQLTRESGLLGVSGVCNDIRDIAAAADGGNRDARLALDLLVHSIRHWIGAILVELGGLDALVFTAGIGEHRAELRARSAPVSSRSGWRSTRPGTPPAAASEADIHAPTRRPGSW